MRNNKIRNLIYASVLAIGFSSSAYAADAIDFASATNNTCPDSNCSYQAKYAAEGCSEAAWNQQVSTYNRELNKYAQATKEIDKSIVESVLDPNKIDFGDCLGSAGDQFKDVMKNLKNIGSKLEDLNANGFGSVLGSLLKDLGANLVDTVKNEACKAASSSINSALKDIGLSQINSALSNPFGVLKGATGYDISKYDQIINNSVKSEFNDLIKR